MAESVFRTIIDWAQAELSPWQQVAVNRLVENGEFTEEDLAEVVEMVRSSAAATVKIEPASDPQPEVEGDVFLVSLEHVCGVNALAPKQTLSFGGPKGLTVIYGDNGSGKTGYSKILKRACRSRDRKPPPIVGDVFAESATPPPEATFTFQRGDEEQSETWTPDASTSDALAAVSVFDSRCCRAHVEDDGDVSFTPYGLEVFDQLGGVFAAVKAAILKEADAIAAPSFSENFSHVTVTDAIQSVLNDRTDEHLRRIRELAILSDAEVEKIKVLQGKIAQLAANDPMKLAESRRKLASRVSSIANAVEAAQTPIGEFLKQAPDALRRRDDSAKLAAAASEIAFGEEPVQGVGTDQWKRLFEHARAFSLEVAYPQQQFPYVEEDSKCVLCHQPLGTDAKARMVRFTEFMSNKAEADARMAETDYEKLRSAIIAAARPLALIEDSLIESLEPVSESVAGTMRTLKEQFTVLEAATRIAASAEDWTRLSCPSSAGLDQLKTLSTALQDEASELEKNSNATEQEGLKSELNLLCDRRGLSKCLGAVEQAAIRMAEKRRLSTVAGSINTRQVTDKAGKVTSQLVTKELCSALNVELKALGASELEVEFATKGSAGSHLHYLRFLKAPKHARIEDVLSEGEHRILGLAAFLAEIKQASHRSAIVLDDPVSSLDHLRRDAVADRLVEEADNRQVVVLTHDMAFLHSLERAAAKYQTQTHRQAVQRTHRGAGVVSKHVYPEEMKLKDLVKQIGLMADEIARLDLRNPERRSQVGELYSWIRACWERLVEESLLNGVVKPFDKAVRTMQLKGVQVEDDDYRTVYWAMAEASEVIEAHRTPAAGGPTTLPTNEKIANDVQHLKDYLKAVNTRSERVSKLRKMIESPVTT